jgi:hypothetical protein
VEVLLGQRRQRGALDTDHSADKGVDHDQQRELRPVRLQAQLDPLTHHQSWRPDSAGGAAVASRLQLVRLVGPLPGLVERDDLRVVWWRGWEMTGDGGYEVTLAELEEG